MTSSVSPSTTTTPTTASKTAASSDQETSVLTSDFNTFLKMLTAQARNQDPLEPLDSTQYASQLAQFSMVEQQVKTNDSLNLLSGQFGVSNMAALASWVGMEARAATTAYFDGSALTLSPSPVAAADEVYLVVRNEDGNPVQREPISNSTDAIEWAGVDEDGEPLANGLYSFEIEGFQNGEQIQSEAVEVYGRIVEAQAQGSEVVLVLEGGQTIKSADVTALRESR